MEKHTPAPIWRQLLAMLYDSFCVIGLLTLCTSLMLPLHHYHSFKADNLAYRLILACITFGYFSFFWRTSKQTIGMRAWKIYLHSQTTKLPSWKQCALRFLTSIPAIAFFGLGIWSQILDKDRRSWHDKLSGTQLLMRTSC